MALAVAAAGSMVCAIDPAERLGQSRLSRLARLGAAACGVVGFVARSFDKLTETHELILLR